MSNEPIQNPVSPEISADLLHISAISLAFQQNSLPFIHQLRLKNNTSDDINQIECRFSSSPAIVEPKSIVVDRLPADEELSIDNPDIKLGYDQLSVISEETKTTLSLEIVRGETTLFSKEYELTAFSADQWLGTGVIPELLAAFVTPNLEVVTLLQSLVAEELQKATDSPSIEGYQADRKRAYEICAAIYRAIHTWGIRYANPPSSFASPGQRIRFADTIYQYRLATCLDSTLLFASVMEHCGLHPVIMLQKGHAYIGCHLVDRYFPDVPMDDLQTIRKLVDLDEFVVVETTAVTQGATFSDAEARARAGHLNIDGEFVCAIDVVRARYSKIKPLPLKRSVNGIEFTPPERSVAELGDERKRNLQTEIDLSRLERNVTPTGRVARWSQKLLDLSRRNRLLNVRDTKQVIPVACSDITTLEDKIAANSSLSLNALSNLLSDKDLHDMALLRTSEISSETKALLDKELSQGRLWTNLSPADTTRRLTEIYRQGRSNLEEGGVNTLFLALGFLEWKVSPNDEKSHLAPILLIPIRIQRKSIAEGFRISRVDEDAIINETLLELLRSQFKMTIPGLSPLPTDASGIDVALVLQIIKQSIKEMKGWEVREEARIGLFSFSKFTMWNDMTSRIDALRGAPLVNHLIEGSGLFDDGIQVFDPKDVGSHLDFVRLFCPVSADSSQLAAVLYSELGKNFVLHGPPGTGKSQTITNIIAHNLALGKKVLFVSEKKAALDVVHKRLSSIGLKPFCLELHSNKSGKTQVLAQFSEVLNVPEQSDVGAWDSTTQALEQLRGELNEYVTALHRRYPNMRSAYDCFSRILNAETSPEGVTLSLPCLTQTQEELEACERAVSDLANARQATFREALDALHFISAHEWTPLAEKTLLASLHTLQAVVSDLKSAFAPIALLLGLPDGLPIPEIYQVAELAESLKLSPDIPEALISENFPDDARFLSNFLDLHERDRAFREKFRNYNFERFAELDLQGIGERIRRNQNAFFLFRFFKNNTLLKELSGIKKLGGAKLSISELTDLLPDAESYVRNHAELSAATERVKPFLGKLWNAGDVLREPVEAAMSHMQTIWTQVGELAAPAPDRRSALLVHLRNLLPQASTTLARDSVNRTSINTLLDVLNRLQTAQWELEAFSSSLQDIENISLLAQTLRDAIDHIADLRGVMRYRRAQVLADELGLASFVQALDAGTFAADNAANLFSDLYHKEMLDQILAETPVLCNFSGSSQEQRIQHFRELDQKYTALSRRVIFSRLAAALPRRRSGPCPEGTELGILKRECEKRARQKPIRQLLGQIPTLASILKPCFLMSPLSVAQYLPAEADAFDLIVFDEASQIPVWDAIGVITRGRQLIVVGDPKQMPPTNFFQKGEAKDVDETTEEVEDMESILDECIAAGIHSTHLNWHYRSRHEALISFSNHYYYDDRLFTFPAARKSPRLGVRFEFVPKAVYDRKASRTNRAEAVALVDYIFERLDNPSLRQRSIGVVTFSQAQKDLIEDLIEHERVRHPNLETYFSDQNEEPLFVKNLENVQGDERDVILFSICYAPDAEGRFSMNFGPLNRQGGERRLNVAITRAKEQVVVFSSIHAEQIDLSRTQATGAMHLKHFLDYAERGFKIQNPRMRSSQSEGLVETIATFLAAHDFKFDRNVGCSDHKIDLAVYNPDSPSDYMLAIECDGPSYAAQKTARDRDQLRTSVLQSMGWHTYRAWTVDWKFDRPQAEKRLLAFIDEIKSKPSAGPATPPPPTIPTEPPFAAAPPSPQISERRRPYRVWKPSAKLISEAFYDIRSRRTIQRQINEIILQEGPIFESLLKKRLARAWGFTRIGDNIQTILQSCMPQDVPRTQIGAETVLWPADKSCDTYRDYRVAEDDDSRRTIDEIPPEEIANAMDEVLTDFSSCEKDTLFREAIKHLGFTAVTAKARIYLELGLARLQRS